MTGRKRKFFSDIGLKVLAVALALSFWFFVTYRGQSEMTIDVPLEFRNVPKGVEVLKHNVRKVSLSISGHERLLKGLRPMDVRAVVDLGSAKKGESEYYFDNKTVVVPRTIKVLRIEPASVRVVLDESIKKTVPVKASVTGSPEKGYKIKSIETKPSFVEIEGPKTEVARVAVLRTEPIDIAGLDADITEDVRLNINGRNVRTKITDVTVKITMMRVPK